jgi:hypothetical protein
MQILGRISREPLQKWEKILLLVQIVDGIMQSLRCIYKKLIHKNCLYPYIRTDKPTFRICLKQRDQHSPSKNVAYDIKGSVSPVYNGLKVVSLNR